MGSGRPDYTGSVVIQDIIASHVTFTVQGNVTVSGNVTIQNASIAVTQSGAWSVTISGPVTITGDVSIVGGVTITGSVDATIQNASIAVTQSGGWTFTGAVTISSGTVNVSTAAGVTVNVGKVSYTPLAQVIANDDGFITFTTISADQYYGKYFPAGMRGYIKYIDFRVKNTTGSDQTLTYSLAAKPGGAVIFTGTLDVEAGADEEKLAYPLGWIWDYDSLFLWINPMTTPIRLYYDSPTYPDTSDLFHNTNIPPWEWSQDRLHWRIAMEVQTPYPLPIEGTVTIKEIDTFTGALESGGNLDAIETDIDTLVGNLDVALSTRALETGGNLASILTQVSPCTAIGTIADVTAAAAPTQLIAASTPCKAIIAGSLAANTGNIRIGDGNVSASRGKDLAAGDSIVLVVSNVNLVYVFGNASDKVSITYVN